MLEYSAASTSFESETVTNRQQLLLKPNFNTPQCTLLSSFQQNHPPF
jgi:hypothetical protein